MKFRKKPVTVDAVQWFKNGDHPEDNVFRPFEDTGEIPKKPREGAVVRYFRSPYVPGHSLCTFCGLAFHYHGWLDLIHVDEPQDDDRVCPGDWIITDEDGEHSRCTPEALAADYERVD